MLSKLPPIERVLTDLESPSVETRLDVLGLLAANDARAFSPNERTRLCEALLESASPDLGALGWGALASALDKFSLWLPDGVFLPTRPEDLPTHVELAWRQLELLLGQPAQLDALTLEAIARTDLARISFPLETLEALADLEPLPTAVLDGKLGESIRTAAIPSEQFATMLLGWLERSAPLARLAIKHLARPWVCQSQEARRFTHVFRRCIKSGDDLLARGAIEILSLLEDADAINLASRDPEQTTRGHLLLLMRVGHLLPHEALAHGFRLAIEDPWQYGDAMVSCLEKMHARGVFLKPEQAPDLLELFDRHAGFLPDQATKHIYVIRDSVYALLDQLPPEDPRWFRLLDLVPALRDEHREALLSKLLAAPEPLFSSVCRIARVSGTHCLEQALLSTMEKNADAALRALEACGGEQTARTLEALILEEDGAPLWLRPSMDRALATLWHFGDPASRQTLLSRLEPAALPARIFDDLGPRIDERTLELLMLSPQVGEQPERSLRELCEHAGCEALRSGAIDILLTRTLQTVAGDRATPDPARPWLARSEPILSEEVEDALDAYGQRLYARGSLAAPALARAESAAQAGRALRAHLLHIQIERAEDARVLRIALDALARTEAMENREQILSLTRHDHPDVRKKAILVLSTHASDPGLIPRFGNLAKLPDIQTARQAVEALGRSRDPGATPSLIEALEHQNMNIKLSAAEALATSGDTRAIEPLLGWLERHDHERFRTLILRALDAILKDSRLTVLMTRLSEATSERKIRLLRAAINGLSIHTLRARDTLGDGAVGYIYEGVDLGQCRLSDFSRQELLAWLGEGAGRWVHSGRGIFLDAPLDEARLGALLADVDALDLDASWVEQHAPLLLGSIAITRGEALERLLMLLSKSSEITRFVSTEAHLDTCAQLVMLLLEEPMSPSRERITTLLEKLASALSLSGKRAVLASVRGIEAFPGGDGRDRARLLEALGVAPEPQDIRAIFADCEVARDPDSARQRASKLLFPRRSNTPTQAHIDALEAWRERDDFAQAASREELVASIGASRVLSYLLERFERGEDPTQDVLEHILALAHLGSREWRSHITPTSADDVSTPWRPSRAWRVGKLQTLREHEDAAVRAASAMALLGTNASLTREEAQLLLERYLRGDYELSCAGCGALVRALERLSPHLLLQPWEPDQLLRWFDLLEHTSLPLLSRHVRALIEIWRGADAKRAERARLLLARLDGDLVFAHIYPSIRRGEHALIGLISRSIIEDAHVRELIALLESQGERRLAQHLLGLLREGHLLDPATRKARERDLAMMLSPPAPIPPEERVLEQGEGDVLSVLQSEDRYEVRAALRRVPSFKESLALEKRVVAIALEHEDLSLRSAAHRALRQISSRQLYLDVTRRFLDDPRRDTVRQAIRILAYGGSTQEVGVFVEIMLGNDPMLAKQAREGLLVLGEAALPALTRARDHARPDKRPAIDEVMAQIQAGVVM
jgi:HEAT repeat protein